MRIYSSAGKLDHGTTRDAVRRDVRAACQPTADGRPRRIVIHFHGGLVPRADGDAIAAKLQPTYERAGATPYFFIWQSGLLETVRQSGTAIASERLFRLLRDRITRTARRKFAQTAAERAAGALPLAAPAGEPVVPDADATPPADLTELSAEEQRGLEAELTVDVELREAIDEVAAGLVSPAEVAAARLARDTDRARVSSATLMDPDAVARYVDRPAPGTSAVGPVKLIKGIVVVAARVIHRFVRRRDHGLRATVVEEILREFYVGPIGGWVWGRMKDHAAAAFSGDANTAAGLVILDALAAALEGGAPPPVVTLVGHSTGAIHIAHFLTAAESRGLPLGLRFDVVLLAPAISCDLMAGTLLGGPAAMRVRHYRSFGMSDALEIDDAVVPALGALYPASLLYLVSGVFEESADLPLVGMQRYHDARRYAAADFPSVEAVRRTLLPVAPVTVWSRAAAAADGRRSTATSHGGFDDDPATVSSLEHLVAHGF